MRRFKTPPHNEAAEHKTSLIDTAKTQKNDRQAMAPADIGEHHRSSKGNTGIQGVGVCVRRKPIPKLLRRSIPEKRIP